MEESTRVIYNAKLAVLIRALRNSFGLNQQDLSIAAGCSRLTINRIEAMDKNSPRGDTVDNILQVFREHGAQISMSDNEISIKFNKEALLFAEKQIKSTKGKKNVTKRMGVKSSKKEVDHGNDRFNWVRLFSPGGEDQRLA